MLISRPAVTLCQETVELHFHLFVEKETEQGRGGGMVEKHENMRPLLSPALLP